MKQPESPLSLKSKDAADFIHEVEERSGQKIADCYQCGNCSASCGYTRVYDYPVNQIMRLIQLGQKDLVLHSHCIWLCASCQACTTRCPCGIDVARVMETLRIMSVEQNTASIKNVKLFYDEFINSVRRFGRVFETGLIALYNFRSLKPFTDVDLGPKMLLKGKLGVKPHKIKNTREITGIFKRFEKYRDRRVAEISGKKAL